MTVMSRLYYSHILRTTCILELPCLFLTFTWLTSTTSALKCIVSLRCSLQMYAINYIFHLHSPNIQVYRVFLMQETCFFFLQILEAADRTQALDMKRHCLYIIVHQFTKVGWMFSGVLGICCPLSLPWLKTT